MNWYIVKNDLKRNKGIHLALLSFMTLAAALAIVSVIVAVQTFTSIANLYQSAQPPHFLQMHKGPVNEEEIRSFMESRDEVTDWQVVTMIDIYGDNMTIGSHRLTDCMIDLSLVKQNPSKDLLLNSTHDRVCLKSGEIGIPILLMQAYDVKIGDPVIINCNGIKKTFAVKEFVLDAQMNSSMCSSTRILLSDEDYNELLGKIGENEFLIEAYLKDKDLAGSFQTTYEAAKLPQNGQAVTYTMIFLLSALTDIIKVFVLMLAGILLTMIAFLCIKYTILASLEEEMGEIGTMKAIGIPFKEIREMYLSKYRMLSMAGVLLGFCLAIAMSGLVTGHISTTFGKSRISLVTMVFSIVTAVFVNWMMTRHCRKILNKMKKLTVVDALVNQSGLQKLTGKTKDGLGRLKQLPVNWASGIWEVVHHIRQWMVVLIAVIISVMLIVIPANLVKTMGSDEFVTYMGSSDEDLMIEVENGASQEEGQKKASEVLLRTPEVSSFARTRRVCVQTKDTEGKRVNLHLDCGEESGEGIRYLSGKAPGKDEIALSYLNAENLAKKVGDQISIKAGQEERTFLVSGIYQDVTSGGYTAKTKSSFPDSEAELYTFTVDLRDKENAKEISKDMSEQMGPEIRVYPMEEFSQQTLGPVVKMLKGMMLAVLGIGVFLSMLITVLFLKLRIAKDQSELAVLKAIGFRYSDLVTQYRIKIGFVTLLGIIAGIILAHLLGEPVINLALQMAGLGIKQVVLQPDLWMEFVICPVLILSVVLTVTGFVMKTVHNCNIVTMINE